MQQIRPKRLRVRKCNSCNYACKIPKQRGRHELKMATKVSKPDLVPVADYATQRQDLGVYE
jgi:hypothetical protein